MLNHNRYIFLLILLLLFGCRSNKDTIPRNLEMIYNPSSSKLHPQIRVYNTSDTTSVFVMKIIADELLFNQANPENKLLARVELSYNLYDLNEKDRFVDSSRKVINFDKKKDLKYLRVEIPFYSKKGYDYILEVISTDLNRKSKQYSFLHVDRSTDKNIQDFLIYNRLNDKLWVTNYYQNDKIFDIEYYNEKYDSLNVFYFNGSYDAPKPPYEKEYVHYNFTKEDTSWTLYTDSMQYNQLSPKGIYYLTKEDTPINGYPLINFGEYFPRVISPKDLMEPLSYFGVNDSTLQGDSTGQNTKLAIDNFWIEKANNLNKSRELIRLFYNRVMFANLYFTSFLEGWKTDRGMIYVIYGTPDYVFKSDEEEKWIYNPVDLGPGYSFTFKYLKNPFSLNHFILDRDKLKSTGWHEAIEYWESGEVYYYQN